MTHIVAIAVSAVFLVLGLWHFYMAASGLAGMSAAVPSRDGRSLFVPSIPGTLAVGVVLIALGVLVLSTAGVFSPGLPRQYLGWMSYALALGLLARAVGEFRYVGFFKRVRGTPFARMDTLVYSPLCLVLSAGVAFIAYGAAL